MFGYVTVYKDCMEESDYELFCSYYCGLCRAIGKECSQVARLGLSYDITFLAILLSAVTDNKTTLKKSRCIIHPLKERQIIENEEAIYYAANMGVILSYLKFKDDWADDKSYKARLMMQMFNSAKRTANKKYPLKYKQIEAQLKRLSKYERENRGLDEAADCFASILRILFTPDFIEDKSTLEVLGWLGYNIGRWIYVMDAYNDIEKDLKSKSYNPFLRDCSGDIKSLKEGLKERLEVSLTLNLDELANTYELLKIYRNDRLLRHIIYMALKVKQNKILGEINESV